MDPLNLPERTLLLCFRVFTDFSSSMENWGLITYRTTAVLYDEKASVAKYKNRIAYVVAHELAHQWFGSKLRSFKSWTFQVLSVTS